MALNRGNKRYSDVFSKEDYIKSLQEQNKTVDDGTDEIIRQLKQLQQRFEQRSTGNSQTVDLLSDYLVNKGTGVSNKTLQSSIQNQLNQQRNAIVAQNTTNTANPVPTVPTVQQEQDALLRDQQNAAQQAAVASYQRLLKYLPQLNKERGYAGLGISEATKAEAWNDLQSRLAQIAMYYTQAQEEKNATTSQNALNYLSSELEGATSAEEAQNIINRYQSLLLDSDKQLANAIIGGKNWTDLYKKNAATATQNELSTTLANAGYSTKGVASFNKNKSRWWGQGGKWTVGDGFTVKDSSGNTYGVEIAEVNPKTDDIGLIYAANAATTGDVFLYGNDLYMVRDVVKNGELTRELYKLKQSGNKTKEFGDLMRLYKQQSELS